MKLMASDVRTQAQSALAESPIAALHDLQVDDDGDRLVISGRVHSFYHKQLAQEVVRSIAPDVLVVNRVDVQYPPR